MLALNGATYVRLLPGIPQMALVPLQSYVYFTFDAVFLSKEVDIAVKANTGDPDIYVTADGSQPTASNYRWRSGKVGSDELNITSSDPYWRGQCSIFGCNFNIGVYGYQQSTFAITATVK